MKRGRPELELCGRGLHSMRDAIKVQRVKNGKVYTERRCRDCKRMRDRDDHKKNT